MLRHKDIIYENYPLKITFMRVLLLILMLFSGNIILFDINTFLLIAYDVYLLFFFYFVIRFVCKFCYYHGKNCDKGLGKLVKYFYPNIIDDIVLFWRYGNICTILTYYSYFDYSSSHQCCTIIQQLYSIFNGNDYPLYNNRNVIFCDSTINFMSAL